MRTVQALHCLLTESLSTTKYMNGEQRSRRYFAYAQDNLHQRLLRMFEGTFTLDAALLICTIRKDVFVAYVNSKDPSQPAKSHRLLKVYYTSVCATVANDSVSKQ